MRYIVMNVCTSIYSVTTEIAGCGKMESVDSNVLERDVGFHTTAILNAN